VRRTAAIGGKSRQGVLLIIVLAIACFLYLLVLSSTRFGTYHDDGIYVATAKSLATGQGYNIISLPYEPAQTKYPPLYPFLLSLIWKVYPEFPQNLTAMTLLSVISTLGFLSLGWRYLLKREYARPWQVLAVVAMTALNWRTMILATSIYSEMLFALLSVGALFVAEQYETEPSWQKGVAAGALMGLAFLTRSSGVALLIAVAVHFAVRRRFRPAMLPIGVGSVFVIGWVAWSYFNKTTFKGGNSAYYTSYVADLASILSNLAAQSAGSKIAAVLTIAGENLIGAIIVSIPMVCLGLNYDWVAGLSGFSLGLTLVFILLVCVLIAAGFVRHCRRGLRLLHVYVISFLVLHLFWPYASYDRFLLCILPFVLVFLMTELSVPLSLIKREASANAKVNVKISAAFLFLILIFGLAFVAYGYVSGIKRTLASMEPAAKNAAEDANLIQWIKQNSDPEDVLICYRDPKYYLYTGRKAISFSWLKQGSSWEGQQSLLLRIVSESGGRYLILTPNDFNHDYDEQLQRQSLRTLVDENRTLFTPVFTSEANSIIYRIERTQ